MLTRRRFKVPKRPVYNVKQALNCTPTTVAVSSQKDQKRNFMDGRRIPEDIYGLFRNFSGMSFKN